MAIKRYYATKDNTITNAFKSNLSTRGVSGNMGQSDILEVFSIYAQASSSAEGLSSELSRVLIQFNVTDFNTDRTNGVIPASGSVNFFLTMYDAEHTQTTPKDYTLLVQPISKPWDEGLGLDMEEYSDEDSSNWLSSSGATTWNAEGGDYIAPSYNFTQSFDTGFENLEVDITSVVEEQITGVTEQVTGTIFARSSNPTTANLFDAINGNVGFILKDTEGNTAKFQFFNSSNTSVDADSIKIDLDGVTNQLTFNTALRNAINSSTIEVTASLDNLGAGANSGVRIGQTFPGTVGNTVIEYTRNYSSGGGDPQNVFAFGKNFSGGLLVDVFPIDTGDAAFVSGSGLANYGFGVRLTGSDETATDSYYTKMFFARGSQFFHKRPVIEARWDDSKKDNREDFFLSSSLVPASDNLMNLYLYNVVRGQLTDIPAVGTGKLNVNIYSGTTAPSGDKLFLPVGGGVLETGHTNITASHVETGIYSCSFAYVSSSITTIFDVWNSGGIEYHTGSAISVKTFDSQDYNFDQKYVSKVINLRAVYNQGEKVRFRLYTRQKDWSPTIYTVASSDIETSIIDNTYYRFTRVNDNLEVIPFGTGSLNHTRLSYDASGSYFDLEMGLFDTDTVYELSFAYLINGSYVEQPERFRFRVE